MIEPLSWAAVVEKDASFGNPLATVVPVAAMSAATAVMRTSITRGVAQGVAKVKAVLVASAVSVAEIQAILVDPAL